MNKNKLIILIKSYLNFYLKLMFYSYDLLSLNIYDVRTLSVTAGPSMIFYYPLLRNIGTKKNCKVDSLKLPYPWYLFWLIEHFVKIRQNITTPKK